MLPMSTADEIILVVYSEQRLHLYLIWFVIFRRQCLLAMDTDCQDWSWKCWSYFVQWETGLHEIGLRQLKWSDMDKVGSPHGMRTTGTLHPQSWWLRRQQLLWCTTCSAFLLWRNCVSTTYYALQHSSECHCTSVCNTLCILHHVINPSHNRITITYYTGCSKIASPGGLVA